MSEIDLILRRAMKKRQGVDVEKNQGVPVDEHVAENLSTKPEAPTRVNQETLVTMEVHNTVSAEVEDVKLPFEEEEVPGKMVITIYGEKGTGKTTTALGFREKVLAFSFDGKTAPVKFNIYGSDPRIKVLSPLRYWDKTDKQRIPESAKQVWLKIMETLDIVEKSWRPDWIVVDAVEEFERLLEQVMRYDYHLGPYDGIANRNVWKYRKDLFIGFLHRAMRVARYGVIFTTYPEYSEIVVNGEVVNRKRVPKWADYLQMVTDVVILTEVDDNTGGYRCKIITSKYDQLFPSGRVFNVTGTSLWNVLNLSSKIKAFLKHEQEHMG